MEAFISSSCLIHSVEPVLIQIQFNKKFINKCNTNYNNDDYYTLAIRTRFKWFISAQFDDHNDPRGLLLLFNFPTWRLRLREVKQLSEFAT